MKSPVFDPKAEVDPKMLQLMANYEAQRTMIGEVASNPASEEVPQTPPFEETLLQKIKEDYANAKQFLGEFHRWCLQMSGVYHNAKDFDRLQTEFKFPMPLTQKIIDQCVADMLDKLFYSGRPASAVPKDGTAPDDVDAKQAMLDYQDKEDKIYTKAGQWLRSVGLTGICMAQVDYVEKMRREWVQAPVYRADLGVDSATGQPVQDVDPVTGQPKTQWEIADIPAYRGALTKRLNVEDVFFTSDKTEIGDGFPIMVRSIVDDRFFKSEPFYFNTDQIITREKSPTTPGSDGVTRDEKLAMQGFQSGSSIGKRTHEYVEWQGFVNKLEVYQYLISRGLYETTDLAMLSQIDPNEDVWVIAGMTDGQTLNRCDPDPLRLGRENIVVGTICAEDEGMIGIGLARLVQAIQRGSDGLTGYLVENFKQIVNAGWVINKNSIVAEKGAEPKVNKAGFILWTNGDVDKAARRVEMANVAPDIWEFLQFLDILAQDASGLNDPLQGKTDTRSNTLGQTQLAIGIGSLRLRNYLKTFEDTFIRPLYELRDWVNSTFIDGDYAYYVLGEAGLTWQQIQPGQIKAGIDFICESSTRETNKAVQVQQLIQFTELAPLAQAAGIPVRIDKLMESLAKDGFGWSDERIREVLPTIAMEEQGMDVNGPLVMATQAAMIAKTQPPGPPGEKGKQKQPSSEQTTEGQVTSDLMQAGSPQNFGVQ